MDAVHGAGEDEDFRIGVSEVTDVVGVFDAGVGYQYLTADRIGPPVGDRQRGAARCHGNPQQQRKEGAWLHRLPHRPKAAEARCIRVIFWNRLLTRDRYTAASIYRGRLKSKLNQSK